MDTIIKDLIDEFIYYRKDREPLEYLNYAFDNMGDNDFVTLIGLILQWQKESALNIGLRTDLDKFEFESVLQSRFKMFFEQCPQISEIFLLQHNYITWSENIIESEKFEIRYYIN